MAAGLTQQRDRPFPQFSNVTVLFPTLGVSNYHAGVLRVERRFAHGFNVLSTYTWSKFLNNTDEGGANIGDPGVYSDFYNRSRDYGPSANDIRQRATFSSVWELPIGTGRRWISSGWLAPIVGNWSLGMLGTLQSGPPFTVTTQTNSTNAQSAGAPRARCSSGCGSRTRESSKEAPGERASAHPRDGRGGGRDARRCAAASARARRIGGAAEHRVRARRRSRVRRAWIVRAEEDQN